MWKISCRVRGLASGFNGIYAYERSISSSNYLDWTDELSFVIIFT